VGSGNAKCANCMVSCGYEPTAMLDGFLSLSGFWGMVKGTFSSYKNQHALKQLNEWDTKHAAPLVQIATPAASLEETNA
jgi:hypothetical protein